MPETITVVIADDHPVFRKGLYDAMIRNTSYKVVGEAADGKEAYRLIKKLLPTLAILDIEMPGLNGLDVARRINDENLPVRVIILSMYDEQALFNKAIDAGVKGYILKESAVGDLLAGLSVVAEGKYYFSPTLTSFLVRRNLAQQSSDKPTIHAANLTPTEQEILHLISESLSSREIAERLYVSLRTVETHRYNISHKLGLNGSYALLRYALGHKDAL
jgi:DNA-binding NarL/FixJ family response regulator